MRLCTSPRGLYISTCLEVLQQIEHVFNVCVQIFRTCFGSPAFCLQLRSFEFYVQRVQEAVHQAAECRDCRQFDYLRVVEVPGEFLVCLVVITRFVPIYQFSPVDNGLLAFIKKRALEIIITAQGIELFLGPACSSPNQAIVLNSIFARVQR